MKDAKGHGSNAKNEQAAAVLASGAKSAAVPIHSGTPPKMSKDEFQAIFAESKQRSKEADAILTTVMKSARNQVVLASDKRSLMISRSLDPKFDLRATDFDERGPSGHREYARTDLRGLKDEIFSALSGGYKVKAYK